MSVKTRDPLAGMPADIRASFDKAPRACQQAYVAWWPERPEPASAHRDTWDSFLAGWLSREEIAERARHMRASR
jgi:hypothetical protein